MSLDLSNYDLYVRKGDTLRYTFTYKNTAGVTVDLTNYVGSMHVRRSSYYTKLIAELDENYPVGCFGRGATSDFESGSGVTGTTGGIQLNYNGTTGSVYIEIDSTTTSSMPVGRHNYDLQLYNSSDNTRVTPLRGRFEVMSSTIKD